MAARHRRESFAALWDEQAPSVRRQLSKLGVDAADLDDVVQEVFLVAHELGDDLAMVQQPDAWVREVCRRIAAGYRRRAHRRREVSYGEPPEVIGNLAADAELEEREAVDRLHQALQRLDDESRDIVALHQLGSLPLTEVATLVDADRKTVSKRLSSALRRLTQAFRADDGVQATGPSSGLRPSTRPSVPPAEVAQVRPLVQHRDVHIGLLGALVIAVWRGPPTIAALERLDEAFLLASEVCGGHFGYLAVVEATTKPPTLESRQKIEQMIKAHAERIHVYATALEGGAAWIARPIMTALFLLARPPFPTHFFQGTATAADWLAKHWHDDLGTPAPDICAAVERLREP